MTNIDNAHHTMEDVNDYLITHDSVAIIAPNNGNADHDLEMVHHTLHGCAMFKRDNVEIWNFTSLCHAWGPGWNWIATNSHSTNGRALYLSIKSHYLGDSFQVKLKAAVDKTIMTVYYDGRARTFTLKRYCEHVVNIFADLEGAIEPVPSDRQVRIGCHRSPTRKH